jgi:hypothetical protein
VNRHDERESHEDESSNSQKIKLPPPRPMPPYGVHIGFRIEPKPLGSGLSTSREKKTFQLPLLDSTEESEKLKDQNQEESKPKDPGIVWILEKRNISWKGYVFFFLILIALILKITRSIYFLIN